MNYFNKNDSVIFKKFSKIINSFQSQNCSSCMKVHVYEWKKGSLSIYIYILIQQWQYYKESLYKIIMPAF